MMSLEAVTPQTFEYRGKDLRQAIRAAQKARGWTYTEVARRSGLDLRPVQSLFGGAANSDLTTVEAVMRVLDVKLKYREFVSDDCLAVLLHAAGRVQGGWSRACRLAGLDRRYGSALKHRKKGAGLYTIQPLMKPLSVEAVF